MIGQYCRFMLREGLMTWEVALFLMLCDKDGRLRVFWKLKIDFNLINMFCAKKNSTVEKRTVSVSSRGQYHELEREIQFDSIEQKWWWSMTKRSHVYFVVAILSILQRQICERFHSYPQRHWKIEIKKILLSTFV